MSTFTTTSRELWGNGDLPYKVILKKAPSMRDILLVRTKVMGGEGVLYQIPDNDQFIVKIFKDPSQANKKYKKISALIEMFSYLMKDKYWKERFENNLTMPRARLYTKDNYFAGYIMNKIDLTNAITLKTFIEDKYRGYNRYNSWPVKLYVALKLVKLLIEMKNIGIIFGDLNQSNFFVRKDGEVIAIDCDSAQVKYNGNLYKLDAILRDIAPPEIKVNPNSVINEKTVSYSLSIVLYRIFMKAYTPFSFRTTNDVSSPINELINTGSNVFTVPNATLPKNAPPLELLGPLKRVIQKGLELNPNNRPTLRDIYMVLYDMYENKITRCSNGHYTPVYLKHCIVCGAKL